MSALPKARRGMNAWIPIVALLLAGSGVAQAQNADMQFVNGGRPTLDCHNCYPYEGKWADRVQRALRNGFPVSIEQDLAWYVDPATVKGQVVVSHTPTTNGSEPTLRNYFFEQVRPIVEEALRENHRDQWPLIVLHFDFKDNRPAILHAVWQLLGEYEPWLSTAVKTSDPNTLSPIRRGPILAITEDSDAQQAVFYDQLPVGANLRVFGSAHEHPVPKGMPMDQLMHWAVTLPADEVLSEHPTNYRRWWNTSWYVVEEGGASRAGAWTPADDARLRALTDRGHQLGFWVRFYTLDGFAPGEDRGWGSDYNFGSKAAAELRWKAEIAAGVNFIATDQMEDVAPLLHHDGENLRPGIGSTVPADAMSPARK